MRAQYFLSRDEARANEWAVFEQDELGGRALQARIG